MKNLLIVFGLLIFNLGLNAQTPIGVKFNEKLADSLLFESINKKRISLGKTPFIKSNKVSKYISQRNVSIMISKSLLHHPKYDWENDSVLGKNVASIYKDYKKLFPNNKNYDAVTKKPYVMTYMEVALSGSNIYNYNTYESLVDSMVQRWYNSNMHRILLLEDDGSLKTNEKSLIGISIKLDNKGGYYACANIVSF